MTGLCLKDLRGIAVIIAAVNTEPGFCNALILAVQHPVFTEQPALFLRQFVLEKFGQPGITVSLFRKQQVLAHGVLEVFCDIRMGHDGIDRIIHEHVGVLRTKTPDHHRVKIRMLPNSKECGVRTDNLDHLRKLLLVRNMFIELLREQHLVIGIRVHLRLADGYADRNPRVLIIMFFRKVFLFGDDEYPSPACFWMVCFFRNGNDCIIVYSHKFASYISYCCTNI